MKQNQKKSKEKEELLNIIKINEKNSLSLKENKEKQRLEKKLLDDEFKRVLDAMQEKRDMEEKQRLDNIKKALDLQRNNVAYKHSQILKRIEEVRLREASIEHETNLNKKQEEKNSIKKQLKEEMVKLLQAQIHEKRKIVSEEKVINKEINNQNKVEYQKNS